MLDETTINKFSQLVYLGLPGDMQMAAPTVGTLADYYSADPIGKAYLQTRFGSIEREYTLWTHFLQNELANIRDFRITCVMDDNAPDRSGFYACAYRSPTGDLVAAFRGSEMLGNRRYRNDYETDFALSYDQQTPQQKKAEQYLAAFREFRESPFCLTGHSLGGNLALYAAVRAPRPELMQSCYAFNAPGFNSGMLAENKQRIGTVLPRLHALQNRHDIVSSLLLGICKPEVIESLFHPGELPDPTAGEIFYPHSNFMFQQHGGRFVRAKSGEKDTLCSAVNRLTRLFLLLPRFVKKAICGMVLDIVYTAQPPAKQLEFLLERVTQYMVRQQVTDEQPELGAGLFWAKQTVSGESAAQCYHKLYHGGLDPRHAIAEAAVLLFQLLQDGCTGPECVRNNRMHSA